MEKVPVTAKGLVQLEEELRQLKNVDRPNVIKAIEEARAHGDLSENAEYHAAKERQGFIESRIKELEGKVSCANVIDPTSINDSKVKFGATVTLIDEDNEQEFIYQIVGEDEANVSKGLLSFTAPLARALIGKQVEESVAVNTPSGERCYEIIKVAYI